MNNKENIKKEQYLNYDQLVLLKNKIDSDLDYLDYTKVTKVDGKGLSTNDFTDELKAKVLSAGTNSFTGAYGDLTGKPTINNVEVNGNLTLKRLGIQPEGNYATMSDVPVKVSDLANDTGYITSTEANALIVEEVGRHTHLSFEKVDTLPSVSNAKKDVIYLVPIPGLDRGFTQYILINGKFEDLGNTHIDLSQYVLISDLEENYIRKDSFTPITNEQIEELWSESNVVNYK